jgi:ribonuclease H / adenosylcobalamin/alpha-ribazole phosphatase
MTLGWDNPTADPTTTILLRHGDTQLSPEHRFSGLSDLPLSASGTRQAHAAARRLATGVPVDAVVSSPLRRAVATAAIAADELGLSSVIDDDLRETDFGDWDGFTLAEIQQRWPAAAAAWRRDPEQAPSGGESFAETARRVNRACDRLLRDHGGQTVLVVSHITPIKILLADLPLSIASTTPATSPDSPGPSRPAANAGRAMPEPRSPLTAGVWMLRVQGPTPVGTRPC